MDLFLEGITAVVFWISLWFHLSFECIGKTVFSKKVFFILIVVSLIAFLVLNIVFWNFEYFLEKLMALCLGVFIVQALLPRLY
jgi:hypothetical protein